MVLCAKFDVKYAVRSGAGGSCKDAAIGASCVSTVSGTLVCPVGSKHVRALGTWPTCDIGVIECGTERQVAIRTYFSRGESLIVKGYRERQCDWAAAISAMVAYVSVAGTNADLPKVKVYDGMQSCGASGNGACFGEAA